MNMTGSARSLGTLSAAIHATAPARAKLLSLLALVFVSLMAGITCSQ